MRGERYKAACPRCGCSTWPADHRDGPYICTNLSCQHGFYMDPSYRPMPSETGDEAAGHGACPHCGHVGPVPDGYAACCPKRLAEPPAPW